MVGNDEVIRTEILRAMEDLGETEARCSVRDGFVTLTGQVSTEDSLWRLEGLVRAVWGVTGVDNRLEAGGGEAVVAPDADVEEVDLSPDFGEDIGTTNPLVAVSEAEPYYPPTDPAARLTDDTDRLGAEAGFGPAPQRRPGLLPVGDEELASAVSEALRMDAATAELDIAVEVRDRVALLRGTVQSLEDIDMAESVAGSVPGIEDVTEELSIEGT